MTPSGLHGVDIIWRSTCKLDGALRWSSYIYLAHFHALFDTYRHTTLHTLHVYVYVCVCVYVCSFPSVLPVSVCVTNAQHGLLESKPLNLPGKNLINLGLLAGNLAAGGVFLTTGDPSTALTALW